MPNNLTRKQRTVLGALHAHPDDHPTTRRLADRIETPGFRTARFGYDEVYSQLRALERKGHVARVRGGQALKWKITGLGMQVLSET